MDAMTTTTGDRPGWAKPRLMKLTSSANAMAGSLCWTTETSKVTTCGMTFFYQPPPSAV